MTTVTLLIFSGRRDPTWELTAGEVEALAPRLERLRSSSEVPALGYRGFLIRSDDPGIPPEAIVRDMPELERFLLRTGQASLSAEVIKLIENALR